MICRLCLKEIPRGQEVHRSVDKGGGIVCKDCERNERKDVEGGGEDFSLV